MESAVPEYDLFHHVRERSGGALHLASQPVRADGDELGRLMIVHDSEAQRGTGGYDLEHHLHYLSEVMVGDTIAVYTRLLDRSAKRIHYMMFMVNETRGALAAIFECVNSFADLTLRRTAPYPDEISRQIDTLLAQHARLGWAAPECGVMHA